MQRATNPGLSGSDDLDHPVPGPWSAHGRFDDCAESHSLALRLRTLI